MMRDESRTDAASRTALRHVPVMAGECLRLLDPRPGDLIADGTVGAGGHSERILPLLGDAGRLIALDRDPAMLARARARLNDPRAVFCCANFDALRAQLDALGLDAVDGILLDLGVASPQLDDPARGLSYRAEGPLDMRLTPEEGLSAAAWINRASEEELARVIYEYGEDRHARRIARAIVRSRVQARIQTTTDLAEIVRRAAGGGPSRLHPARRTFQAVRIHVNDEIGHIERFLACLPALLRPGGRCVVITYHSLEDRPVKRAFLAGAREGVFEVLTRKPLRPAPAEVRENPRSRSAKVRAVRRLGGGPLP